MKRIIMIAQDPNGTHIYLVDDRTGDRETITISWDEADNLGKIRKVLMRKIKDLDLRGSEKLFRRLLDKDKFPRQIR